MADGYELQAVTPSSRLEAGTRIVETLEAVAVTKPHSIQFSVTVDKVAGYSDALHAALAAEAAELEGLFNV